MAWAVIAGLRLRSASDDLRRGADRLSSLADTSSGLSEVLNSIGDPEAELTSTETVEQLEAATAEFDSAHSSLGSPAIAPLRFVPVLGRQIDAIRSLSTAAGTVSDQAAVAVDDLSRTLDQSELDETDRTAVINDTESILVRFGSSIDELDLGPGEGLIGPVNDARNRFQSEYVDLLDTLERSQTAVGGLGQFLEGPTSYLLLGANNAEMRAGSGMVLQAGTLDITDGDFNVRDLAPTADLRLDAPVPLTDEDLERNWGVLDPNREWRSINLTPRFDISAALATAMWTQRTGETPDGAMLVDIVALAKLLKLTGPVTLPDGDVIDTDNVQADLLLNQYVEYSEDRDARRDRVGVIASATFSALNDRAVSAGELLSTLRELGKQRHLMMWSPEPDQQEAWRALGTDGVPDPDGLLLSVINRGANKLDPFLDTSATVTTERGGDTTRVSVEVSVTNNTPGGLPQYVAGPVPETGAVEGQYKGVIALTLPADAGTVRIDGGLPAALGPDGDTTVAATEVFISRNETATVSFSFEIDQQQRRIDVQAGARVPPTKWRVGDQTFSDAFPHEVDLPN